MHPDNTARDARRPACTHQSLVIVNELRGKEMYIRLQGAVVLLAQEAVVRPDLAPHVVFEPVDALFAASESRAAAKADPHTAELCEKPRTSNAHQRRLGCVTERFLECCVNLAAHRT